MLSEMLSKRFRSCLEICYIKVYRLILPNFCHKMSLVVCRYLWQNLWRLFESLEPFRFFLDYLFISVTSYLSKNSRILGKKLKLFPITIPEKSVIQSYTPLPKVDTESTTKVSDEIKDILPSLIESNPQIPMNLDITKWSVPTFFFVISRFPLYKEVLFNFIIVC